MADLDIYSNISSWKKPFHKIRAQIAKGWAKLNSQAEIIGITGSVGKTTTKEAMIKVLGEKFKVAGSEGNLDPVFNIPITLLKIRPWTKKVVLELGIEYPGEMDFYLGLAKPKFGVITQVYWAHTQFLGDLKGVMAEKGKLLESLPEEGHAVLNSDDEYVREMSKYTRAKIFWYGSHYHADVAVSDFLHQGLEGAEFKLKYGGKEIDVSWKILGEHNTAAAAAAASVGILSGMSLEQIKSGLEKLEPQPHRLNALKGPKGSLILDDSYNSSPLAAVMAVETLRSLAHAERAIAVLGEMSELGKYTEAGHREVGKKVAGQNIDLLVISGEPTKFIADEARKAGFSKDKIIQVSKVEEIAPILKKELKKDDVVLVKASRHAHFERIVLALTGKSTKISCPSCGELS